MKIKYYDNKDSMIVDLTDCKPTSLFLAKKSNVKNIVIKINSDFFEYFSKQKNQEYFSHWLKNMNISYKDVQYIYLAKTKDIISDDDITSYYDDLSRIKNTISKQFQNKNIKILDFSNGEYLLNSSKISFDINNIHKYNIIVDGDDANIVKSKIKQIADLIRSKTQSPFEQHLLTLHYLTQYKYRLENNNMPLSLSRQLATIIKSNAQYICCVGYARLYTEIMRELGIDAQTNNVPEHLRARVYLKDPKYNINGIYLVDPTFLCKTSNNNNHFFYYNYYSNVSIGKMIADKIAHSSKSKLIEENYLSKLNQYYTVVNEALNHKFKNRQDFLTYLESLRIRYPKNFYIKDLYNIECLNARKYAISYVNMEVSNLLGFNLDCNIIDYQLDDINKKDKNLANVLVIKLNYFLNKYTTKKITKNDLLKFFNRNQFKTSANDLKNEIEFYKSPKEDRLKSLSNLKKEFSEREDNNANNEVSQKTFDKVLRKSRSVPKFVKEELKERINQRMKDSILKNQKTYKYFQIKDILKEAEFCILKPDTYLYKGFKKYEDNSETNSINSNIDNELGEKYLTYHNRNFTNLSDKEYFEIEKNTPDIDENTMAKAIDTIKKLVDEKDYDLFKQAPAPELSK